MAMSSWQTAAGTRSSMAWRRYAKRALRELPHAISLALPRGDALRVCEYAAFDKAVQAVARQECSRRSAGRGESGPRGGTSCAVAFEGVVTIFAEVGGNTRPTTRFC